MLFNSSETSAAPPALLHDGFLDGPVISSVKCIFIFNIFFPTGLPYKNCELAENKRNIKAQDITFFVCFMQQLHAHKKSAISETSFEEEETALEMLGFIFC